MRRGLFAIASTIWLVFPIGVNGATADPSNLMSVLMTMCMTGGSEEKLEAQGQVEVALTLKKLRTGDIGGEGGVAAKFTKSEWQGIVGGISTGMTTVQAAQASEVRNCLKPYIPGMIAAETKAR